MGTAKVLQEKTKEYAEAMREALAEKEIKPCKAEGCQNDAMNNTGYCMRCWKQKLEKAEQEREKQREERIKREKKIAKSPKLREQVEMEQKANAWFRSHRWCNFCGHFCSDAEGYARLRAIQPKNPGPYDKRWETVCFDCEKAGR